MVLSSDKGPRIPLWRCETGRCLRNVGHARHCGRVSALEALVYTLRLGACYEQNASVNVRGLGDARSRTTEPAAPARTVLVTLGLGRTAWLAARGHPAPALWQRPTLGGPRSWRLAGMVGWVG
jgi:hypothetical protein